MTDQARFLVMLDEIPAQSAHGVRTWWAALDEPARFYIASLRDHMQFRAAIKTHAEPVRKQVMACIRDMRQAHPDEFAMHIAEDGQPAAGVYEIAGREFVLPEGWRTAAGRMYYNDKLVVPGLVGLSQRLKSEGGLADGLEHARIHWQLMTGETGHAVVTTEKLASARTLVPALASYGAPIDSTSGAAVARLLTSQRTQCADMSTVAQRCGWVGNNFALPKWPFDADWTVEAWPSEECRTHAAAFGTAGTLEGYRRALGHAGTHPAVWAVVYASVVSTVMPLCSIGTGAFLSVVGTSGSGKTRMIQLAAASWGRPATNYGLVQSWDTTKAGAEKVASFSNGTGLFLDETQSARPEIVNAIVYQTANGRSAVRYTTNEGTWSLVGLSTGEVSLHQFGLQVGAQNRVLEIGLAPGEAYFFPTERDCDLMLEGVQDNFGHLGPHVVAHIKAMNPGELRTMYAHARERYGQKTNLDRRLHNVLAAMDVVADIVHTVVALPRPPGVVEWVMRQSMQAKDAHDVITQSFLAFLDRLPTYTHNDLHNVESDELRTLPTPSVVRDWLTRDGFDNPLQCIRGWEQRHWARRGRTRARRFLQPLKGHHEISNQQN